MINFTSALPLSWRNSQNGASPPLRTRATFLKTLKPTAWKKLSPETRKSRNTSEEENENMSKNLMESSKDRRVNRISASCYCHCCCCCSCCYCGICTHRHGRGSCVLHRNVGS